MNAKSMLVAWTCLAAGNLWGADKETPLIVLRLSERALNRSLNEPIERKSNVDGVILETHVVGTALTQGQPCLKLLDDSAGASFRVIFRGTTVARTAGHHPPVVIHSRSETEFTAEKTICIEQLGPVSSHSTKIDAKTRTSIEDITTDRRFPIRRIVLRKAWQAVADRQAEVDARAKRDAEARITEAFNESVQERVARLERQLALRNFVSAMLPADSPPAYRSITKDGYFSVAVFAAAPESKTVDVQLPKLNIAEQPMQIWLHRSLVAEQLDAALVNINAMRRLISIPSVLVAAVTDQRQPGGNWTIAGEWYVVQLTSDSLSR